MSMRSSAARSFFGVLLLALPGSAAADARAEVATAADAYKAAAQGRDASVVVSFYTEDAQTFPPFVPTVSGREEIAAFWEMSYGLFDGLLVETDEIMACGDYASEIGHYEILDAEENAIDEGTYFAIWKKVGDRWLVHRDIWNSRLPAPDDDDEDDDDEDDDDEDDDDEDDDD